jgi:HEAT repeat protein
VTREDLAPLIEQLDSSQSAKRRSAAKKLRKLADPAAGPALLAALERELKDARTWETQYQMVMALGECGHRAALPFLEKLAQQPFEATILYLAIGDAIVRLSHTGGADASPVLRLMRGARHPTLVEGAFRAMAMLRLVPEDAAIAEMLAHVKAIAPGEERRLWLAAAAPGWKGAQVEAFIDECARCADQRIRDAAALAKARKYRKWQPL